MTFSKPVVNVFTKDYTAKYMRVSNRKKYYNSVLASEKGS